LGNVNGAVFVVGTYIEANDGAVAGFVSSTTTFNKEGISFTASILANTGLIGSNPRLLMAVVSVPDA